MKQLKFISDDFLDIVLADYEVVIEKNERIQYCIEKYYRIMWIKDIYEMMIL